MNSTSSFVNGTAHDTTDNDTMNTIVFMAIGLGIFITALIIIFAYVFNDRIKANKLNTQTTAQMELSVNSEQRVATLSHPDKFPGHLQKRCLAQICMLMTLKQ